MYVIEDNYILYNYTPYILHIVVLHSYTTANLIKLTCMGLLSATLMPTMPATVRFLDYQNLRLEPI